MRTGLIPNAFATVEDAGTRLADVTPTLAETRSLRTHLARRANLLDKIQEAARAGDEATVLTLADHLSVVRRHTALSWYRVA